MDNTIKEDVMTPIVIDLTQKNELDESWLRMFGENVKGIFNQQPENQTDRVLKLFLINLLDMY